MENALLSSPRALMPSWKNPSSGLYSLAGLGPLPYATLLHSVPQIMTSRTISELFKTPTLLICIANNESLRAPQKSSFP